MLVIFGNYVQIFRDFLKFIVCQDIEIMSKLIDTVHRISYSNICLVRFSGDNVAIVIKYY